MEITRFRPAQRPPQGLPARVNAFIFPAILSKFQPE
jgi:hypothetical protein